MKEKISIIVPVYNAAKYLENCIDSILNQTYKNIELLLVNDGSIDDSLKVCATYSKDPRVRIINRPNMGVAVTRNTGLSFSTGSVIMYVDSDDWLADDSILEKMLQTMHQTKSDILVGNFNKFDDVDNNYIVYTHDQTVTSFSPKHWFENQYNGRKNLNTCFIAPWCKLFKSHLFRNVRFPVGTVFEDDLTLWKLYLMANKITFLDRAVYVYRVRRNNSIMGDLNTNQWYRLSAVHERISIEEMIGFNVDEEKSSYNWRIFGHLSKDLKLGQTTNYHHALLNSRIIQRYNK